MVTYGWPATRGKWGSHLLCTGLRPKRGAAPRSPLFSPPLQSSRAQGKENCEGSLRTPFLSKGRRKTQLPSAFSGPNASEHEVFLRSAVNTGTGRPGMWPKWAGGKLISQAIPSKLFWKQTNKTTRGKQGHAPRVSTQVLEYI